MPRKHTSKKTTRNSSTATVHETTATTKLPKLSDAHIEHLAKILVAHGDDAKSRAQAVLVLVAGLQSADRLENETAFLTLKTVAFARYADEKFDVIDATVRRIYDEIFPAALRRKTGSR